ncbi:MAG: four helix bundle protein [bacterium]|nr:four helix bundle protein [bacterium]
MDVYRLSIEFVGWVGEVVEALPRGSSVRDQLDRASTSIPLNLAEGNAKASTKDRCRYLQIALGSCFECAAAFDVSVARRFVSADRIAEGKSMLKRIAAMLMGMLSSYGTRVSDDEVVPYGELSGDEE